MQKLYYNIADHHLLINTPDANKTARLIPSFKDFRVDADVDADASDAANTGSDSIIGDERTYLNIDRDADVGAEAMADATSSNELLFSFSGGANIILPNVEMAERVDIEGVYFEVYHTPEGTTIAMTREEDGQTHYLHSSPDRKEVITDLLLTERSDGSFLSFFLRIAYGLAAVYHRTLKMHASVIEKEGRALVFMGTSGTGKSTHSRLWQEYVEGCSLLNDDEPIVRLLDDGSVWVYGAPWSGSTPCYRNERARVAAFLHLYQAPENKLTKLGGVQAYASLLQSSDILRSDRANRGKADDLLTDILNIVPVYRLENRPDREAVALSESLL